jgi:hypothetical protein
VAPGGASEGVPLGILCGGPRGDPDVQEPSLGENSHVGRRDGCGSVPSVGRGFQQRQRVLCGAEPNVWRSHEWQIRLMGRRN